MNDIENYKSNDFFKYVENYIYEKLKKDKNFIRYSYFELKVKANLSDEGIDRFLRCSKGILEVMNYEIYFSGDEYVYQGVSHIVGNNEYLVAVKEQQFMQ